MREFIVYAWQYIFDHRISPLRHIPDIPTRHMILQILGLIWALAFSVAIGSYSGLAASVIGHTALISAVAITVATYTTAARKPQVFSRYSGRRESGEHE